MAKMSIWRLIAMCLLIFLLSGVITSYLGEIEQRIISSLKNLILHGEFIEKIRIEASDLEDLEVINPVHVSQIVRNTSLDLLNGMILSEETKNSVLPVADWLIANSRMGNFGGKDYVFWPYEYDWPIYSIEAPWVSGMAQGHAIEVLLSAYVVTNSAEYLDAAKLAANMLEVPIEYGGVRIDVGERGYWYEEYASPSSINHPMVLNGHIFAVEGLFYLSRFDKEFTELFNRGVDAVLIMIPEFDGFFWSDYDLIMIPANYSYQRIHIRQLTWLYSVTGEAVFSDYADKFRNQLLNPFSSFYRLFKFPNRFLVFLFIMNAVFSVMFLMFFIRCRRSARHEKPQL